MNFWLKIGIALVVVWLGAAAAIHWARAAQPTAESVAAHLRASDLAAKSGKAREREIERVEAMLNRVSYDDRQRLQRDRSLDAFFRALTPAEQAAFLDATLPAGFKQMMEAFNKMDPARRKQFVERAVADMKKHEGEQPPEQQQRVLEDQNTRRIIDQGLRSFYNDASADTKLDLAPLIEQMQRNMQNGW